MPNFDDAAREFFGAEPLKLEGAIGHHVSKCSSTGQKDFEEFLQDNPFARLSLSLEGESGERKIANAILALALEICTHAREDKE